MMKRILATMLCLTFLSMSTVALAETVYKTKYGKKYHKQDCVFIKNKDVQSMDIEEAKKKGLKPCGRCMRKKEAKADTSKSKK